MFLAMCVVAGAGRFYEESRVGEITFLDGPAFAADVVFDGTSRRAFTMDSCSGDWYWAATADPVPVVVEINIHYACKDVEAARRAARALALRNP